MRRGRSYDSSLARSGLGYSCGHEGRGRLVGGKRRLRSNRSCGDMFSHDAELVLNGLEFPERPTELDAIVTKLKCELKRGDHRATEKSSMKCRCERNQLCFRF